MIASYVTTVPHPPCGDISVMVRRPADKSATVAASEEITARREQMKDLADDAGAASFEALQAEIHFTEMHQFEVFFMLLLADFQRVPHWIYLTEYPPSMPRQKAEQYIAKEIGALTGDRFTTRQALIRHAIYSTIVPTDPDLLHR